MRIGLWGYFTEIRAITQYLPSEVSVTGLEPATTQLKAKRSTSELHRQSCSMWDSNPQPPD